MSMPDFLKDSEPDAIADEWSYDSRRIGQHKHETRLGHNWQTLGRTRRFLAKTAIAGVAATIPFGLYMKHDVLPEADRLSRTHPEVHNIYEPIDPLNRDTAVVDMVGLGNMDATQTAASLTSLKELGRVWAVQYDNAGLDTEVIASILAEEAESEGVNKIILVGHSMGGIAGIEVARHIHEETEIQVTGVILDCTPDDLDAVRPGARTRALEMMRWIGRVPGARESRAVRAVVEVGARSDRFLPEDWWNPASDFDTNEFRKVLNEVLDKKIIPRNVASNRLIETQINAIAASGVHDDLEALASGPDDKVKPKIIYLRPRDATKDSVVNVADARTNFNHTAYKSGLDFSTLLMEGTGHANPNQEPEIYNATISNYVVNLLVRPPESSLPTGNELAQAVPPEK